MLKANELKANSDFKALRRMNARVQIKQGVLGPDPSFTDPEKYKSHIEGLYVAPKNEQAVRGIGVSIGDTGKVTFRFTDREKIVTPEEFAALCDHYGFSRDELAALFKKRKVKVLHDDKAKN